MLLIGLAGLVLAGLGIVLHAQKHGIKFFYTEKFNLAEYLEQERAERHAHYLKAEKKFWDAEIKILTLEKYQVRRSGDSLFLAVIKNALFHSKKKMSAVRPHTKRKLSAGRRMNDGKSGLLDWGIAVSSFAFFILVILTPIASLEIPSYQKQEVVKVIEYAQPKTAEQISAIQKSLSKQSQSVFKKTDKAKAKRDQARYNADKGTTIELY